MGIDENYNFRRFELLKIFGRNSKYHAHGQDFGMERSLIFIYNIGETVGNLRVLERDLR